MDDVNVNRRQLIKILAASGAAITAAGFVQAKWTKPVVKMGVLPAHAQSSTLHTVAAGEGGFIPCSDNYMISTATISPVDSGISMSYSIAATSPAVISSAATGTLTTNASGVAQLTFNGSSTGGGGISVTWSFTNPSDGTGTAVESYTNTGC